jgi:hypothetical protein
MPVKASPVKPCLKTKNPVHFLKRIGFMGRTNFDRFSPQFSSRCRNDGRGKLSIKASPLYFKCILS